MNKMTNIIVSIFTFFISFMIYLLTMAPTTSFWDCGEFIATAVTMGVPHPPGTPLYLLIGNFFSQIPLFADIGARVNFISVIASAFSVMFTYLISVQLIEEWRGKAELINDKIINYGSSFLGAMTFAVTDAQWFNAVEAEVYSLSTFFTTIVVWLILKWSKNHKEAGNYRYILIIAYILGLATGIHLLNLLTLPFIALIICFKNSKSLDPLFIKFTFMITSIICSLLVFLVIYLGIIKGIPKLANNYGWITPTLLIFLLIITTFIIISINKSSYINLDLLSTTLVSILLVIVGFSTYSTIFIRASQEPRINENSPNTLEEALSYMNRDQYGDWSILDRGSTIKRDENIYWQRYTHDKANPSAPEIRNFVFDYQINEMYLRYFAWQFIGKEDYVDRSWDIRTLDEYYTDLNNNGIWDRTEKFKDINGDGEYSYGNIIKTLQGINWFRYGIPLAFLFGLAGMGHHFYNDRKRAFALLILFLATGLMIIVYLNQYDPQPRERDYSYVGSFFVFSIWISIGVCGLLELLERITKLFFKSYLTETSKIINRLISVGLISIIFLCMPFTMMVTDYNEHDRTGNYVAWDYAYNLLNSCGPNGILFTNGDNDTFPLWYLQEVENVRKDVRVVNLSLLNTPWYIDQLKNQEPKINIDMLDDHIEQLDPINGTAFVLSKWTDQWTEIKIRLEEYFDTQLHQHYSIKDHGIPVEWSPVDVKGLTLYDKEINLELKPSISNYLKLQDIMILEILDDLENNRPIYFAVTVAPSNRMGLEKYLEMEGLVYKITNIEDSNWDPHYASPRINFDKMHSNITETNNYDFIIKTPEEYNASILNDSGIYRYTNLNSPSVYFNNNIMRLVQNYRSGFLQLTFEKLYSDSAQVLAILDEMETYFPTNVIPVSDYQLDVQIGRIYAEAGNKEKLRKRLNRIQLENPSDLSANFLIANIYISDLGDVEKAFDIYLQLKEKYPRVYEVRHELIKIYSSQDKIKEAIAELENYLITEPNHPQASEVLKYLKERL